MWLDKRANFATTEEEKNVTYLLGCTYMSSITKNDCLGNTTSHKNSQICDSAYDDLKQAAERNVRGWGQEKKIATAEEKNVTYLLVSSYISSIGKGDCLGNTTSHKNAQLCD